MAFGKMTKYRIEIYIMKKWEPVTGVYNSFVEAKTEAMKQPHLHRIKDLETGEYC